MLLSAIIVCVSLLLLTLPVGKMEGNGFQFLRFFRWREVPIHEVVDCGISLFPGVGYLRLQYFVWPFGKLYFICYEPGGSVLDFSPDRKLIGRLREQIDHNAATQQEVNPSTSLQSNEKGRRLSLGAFLFSTILGLTCFLLTDFLGAFPPREPYQTATGGQNAVYRFVHNWSLISERVFSWPYSLCIVVALALAVLLFRRKTAGLWFSFFLGALIGRIVLR